jgi:transposase
MMKAVLQTKDSVLYGELYIALELSNKKWKLGFSNGDKHRIKTINAGDWQALLVEIAQAKVKLHCQPTCQIISCYEAGRDGFWIHRALLAERITNHVIDSASIEVSRRKRHVKTDKVDVIAMLRLLIRFNSGEREALKAIRVPSIKEEDERRLHRERLRLIKERGAHSARIKSLLICHGIRIEKMSDIPTRLSQMKAPVIGYMLASDLKNEIRREYQRYKQVNKQVKTLEALQKERISKQKGKAASQIRQMILLKGVGWQSSWILVTEFFSWREFKNTKQVGACAGLTPTPYDSGDSVREQGISKAGNKNVRKLMVELSWLWLRWQPKSGLSQWFNTRFGSGGKRMRRIGIVALARKLLVSLWRYLENGVLPEGAILSNELA